MTILVALCIKVNANIQRAILNRVIAATDLKSTASTYPESNFFSEKKRAHGPFFVVTKPFIFL